jgi:hypothetical protein
VASPVRPTNPIVWPVGGDRVALDDERGVAQVHVGVVGRRRGDDDVVARQRLGAGELHGRGLCRQERQAAVGHDVLALVHVATALCAEAVAVGMGPGDREDVAHEPEALPARGRRARLRRARPRAAGDRGGHLKDVAPRRLRHARDRAVPVHAAHAPGSGGRHGEMGDGDTVARAHHVDGDVDRRGAADVEGHGRRPSAFEEQLARLHLGLHHRPARVARARGTDGEAHARAQRSLARGRDRAYRPAMRPRWDRGFDRGGRHRRRRDGHVVAVAAPPEQDDARDRRHPLAADVHHASRGRTRDAQAPGPARDRIDDGALRGGRRAGGRHRSLRGGGAAGPGRGLGAREAGQHGRDQQCADDDPPLGSGQGHGRARGKVHGTVGRLRGELTGSRGPHRATGHPSRIRPRDARTRPNGSPALPKTVVACRQTRRIYWWWRGILYPPTDVGMRHPSGRRAAPRLPYHAPSRRADRPPRGSLTLS